MSRFDEEPDGDPHGECSAEIHRLEALLSKNDDLPREWVESEESMRGAPLREVLRNSCLTIIWHSSSRGCLDCVINDDTAGV